MLIKTKINTFDIFSIQISHISRGTRYQKSLPYCHQRRCTFLKNLKIKFRDHREVKYNLPWNIAVSFDIDMSFNKNEKNGVL